MRVSFVVPARDEAASLPALVAELGKALDALGGEGEIIVVDDASSDESPAVLARLAATERRLRAVRMRRRSGQSGALAAGFAQATGEALVTLDADLQNDPADAPRLVAALAGADVVCGVRLGRKDTRWKRLSSRVANRVRRALLEDGARDTGCGLKAFRTDAARSLVRFDGWHRFFPALARREGLRVVEVEVSHRPRVHGRTKYGTLDRLGRGVLDLMGVWWLVRRRLVPSAEVDPIVPADVAGAAAGPGSTGDRPR